jgi:hypothetical protein
LGGAVPAQDRNGGKRVKIGMITKRESAGRVAGIRNADKSPTQACVAVRSE